MEKKISFPKSECAPVQLVCIVVFGEQQWFISPLLSSTYQQCVFLLLFIFLLGNLWNGKGNFIMNRVFHTLFLSLAGLADQVM